MQLLPPAKINLYLRVGRVQSDGFHPLLTWMTTIGLFDTLTIDQAPEGIALTCNDASIPCDGRNLIVRAAQLMLESQDEKSRCSGFRIHLSKQIPAGGGLGGGSSDAARILLGLNRLMGLELATEQLGAMAAKLGSDVPFFLHGPSSICTGRGEKVQPIAIAGARWAMLALPGISMPTPRVYQVFDALDPGKEQVLHDQPNWREWTSLNSDELLPRLINELERPAFEIAPQLGQLRSDLEQSLGRIVRMSGSGSTLFTLYNDQSAAERAAEQIERRGVRSIAVEVGVTPMDGVMS